MRKIWSVELKANSWNDDTFNGTFDDCVEYCKKHDYKIDGVEARLAEIDPDDCYCYRIIEEIPEDEIIGFWEATEEEQQEIDDIIADLDLE